jgi:hypothetical protein
MRPDLIVPDDLDKSHDTEKTTNKKEEILTSAILPTRAANGSAVLATQNLIRADGIFDRLRNGKAGYLSDRKVIGPIPAIRELTYATVEERLTVDGHELTRNRHKITGGVATWEGQSIPTCQSMIEDYGVSTFLREQQHQLADFKGALLNSKVFKYGTIDERKLSKFTVGVDPAGGATTYGIIAVALGPGSQVYVLDDTSVAPSDAYRNDRPWYHVVVLTAARWKGCTIVVETNYGGNDQVELMKKTIRDLKAAKKIEHMPTVIGMNAKKSKAERALPVADYYRDGDIIHTKPLPAYEREWTTWDPSKSPESPNLIDAGVWAIKHVKPLRSTGRLHGHSAGAVTFA